MQSRCFADIDKLLRMAKIDPSSLQPTIQSLRSGSSLCSDDVIFFELDSQAVSTLKDGQSLIIRGEANDIAVCCSFDKTFEIKETETSNSLVLFKNDLLQLNSLDENISTREVHCLKRNFYELRPMRPITKGLKRKLESCPYDGTTSQNTNLCTFNDLLDVAGSSEKELINILKNYGACLIEGHWRLVDFDYQCELFRNMIAVVDEAEWPYNKIPTQELKIALSEICIMEVVDHLLSLYTVPTEDSDTCCLHEINVCRLYAEMILRASLKFDLADFRQTWQLSVPDGLLTNFDQIRNLAILDVDSRPETIRYFPVLDLPDEIKERFQVLFEAKEKWTLEEISPFLENVCSGPQEVTKLLLKFARMSTLKNVRMYSRRL